MNFSSMKTALSYWTLLIFLRKTDYRTNTTVSKHKINTKLSPYIPVCLASIERHVLASIQISDFIHNVTISFMTFKTI